MQLGALLISTIFAMPNCSDQSEPSPPQAPAARMERSEAFRNLVVAYFQDKIEGGKLGREHFEPRFMELADEDPDDTYGYESLFFLATGDDPSHRYFEKSIDLLTARHAQNYRSVQLCRWLASPAYFGSASEKVERFIRAVSVRNTEPDVRVEAKFCLATFLRNKSNLIRQLHCEQHGADLSRKLEANCGRLYLQALKTGDAEAISREADCNFEQGTGDSPASLKSAPHTGSIAPALSGQDIAGIRLELRQFQNKVVVLSFWGFGCLPCRAAFPHEKALVERFKGRPFALLGVNNDSNRADVQKRLKDEGITWESWWDGGETGNPIAQAWCIRSWPSVFVIDSSGVIRYRDVQGKALDVAIDSLLLEKEENCPTHR